MLTWFIVISFSVVGVALYVFALLQYPDDEEKILLHHLELIQQHNEKRAEILTTHEEKLQAKKTELKELLQEAKHFREDSKRIAQVLPELEQEFHKWENYELTEEKALYYYEKYKKERAKHA